MKAKLITILKAVAIMVALFFITLVLRIVADWSLYLHLFLIIGITIFGIYHFYGMMLPKKRYYFVSYSHGGGFGFCTLIINDNIFSALKVSEYIGDKYFGGERFIAILYYKELSKEEYNSQRKECKP